ncbi:hypothetical protein [Burkholderia cenocepacia]|uniref:hypothetical protein n=1 Tax=Burkholderia cenocepacia TaxID=95486 RepID=UPI0013E05729|nr:hypothetical protein [Burkholderia cenocepacia]
MKIRALMMASTMLAICFVVRAEPVLSTSETTSHHRVAVDRQTPMSNCRPNNQ